MKLLLLALLGTLCLASALTSYEDYKVFRVWPKTEEQRSMLRLLEDSWTELDFWAVSKIEDSPTDVMVHQKDQDRFIEYMINAGMVPEIFIENLDERIHAEEVGSFARAGMTWTSYYRLDDIYTWFDELAAANSKATVVVGGTTSEGRQIKGLKINNGSGKKAVFLEGGIHAREWISPATITYLTNEILSGTDANFKKIADSFNWYIFPVVNPDGYEFSHTNTRLWRKTRTNYSVLCKGADANRNWDAHWMEQGTSSTCSSDTYGGPTAFSEVETKSLSDYIKTISSELVSYISFHSYSQLLMIPYGHTTAALDNYSEAKAIGQVAVNALATRYGTKYSPVGNIAETIYAASGGSIDWVKQEFGTPLVYVYELRDTGTYGFVLPATQIIPNCLEIQDSLVALFQEAANRGIVTLS